MYVIILSECIPVSIFRDFGFALSHICNPLYYRISARSYMPYCSRPSGNCRSGFISSIHVVIERTLVSLIGVALEEGEGEGKWMASYRLVLAAWVGIFSSHQTGNTFGNMISCCATHASRSSHCSAEGNTLIIDGWRFHTTTLLTWSCIDIKGIAKVTETTQTSAYPPSTIHWHWVNSKSE